MTFKINVDLVGLDERGARQTVWTVSTLVLHSYSPVLEIVTTQNGSHTHCRPSLNVTIHTCTHTLTVPHKAKKKNQVAASCPRTLWYVGCWGSNRWPRDHWPLCCPSHNSGLNHETHCGKFWSHLSITTTTVLVHSRCGQSVTLQNSCELFLQTSRTETLLKPSCKHNTHVLDLGSCP